MNLFEHLAAHDYGELHVRRERESGLAAIVAIHDTRLGPALGGCRFVSYAHEELALVDALRLARGMTYKAAITGLAHGGGKSVILRPAGSFDRTALFRAFGRFVDALGGRYVTAEDSGTSVEDMIVVRSETPHVTGLPPAEGGGGDPSPLTALGVRRGIEACVRHVLGRDLDGIRVAIQGVGHVGQHLARELHALGARLVVADVEPARARRVSEELGAAVVSSEAIFDQDVDVFSPCALGAILDDATIPRLRARIVAGAANNQLAAPRHGDMLAARGIVYAPDYAINAGGLVNVAAEYAGRANGRGYDGAAAREKVLAIHDTIREILERSKATGMPTHVVADRMAEERLARAA